MMARLQPHRLELRAVVQRLVLLGRERVFRLARELAPPCRLLVRLGMVIGGPGSRGVKLLVGGGRVGGWGWGVGVGRSPRLAFSASTFHVSAAAPASAKSPAPAFSAERFHMVASSA